MVSCERVLWIQNCSFAYTHNLFHLLTKHERDIILRIYVKLVLDRFNTFIPEDTLPVLKCGRFTIVSHVWMSLTRHLAFWNIFSGVKLIPENMFSTQVVLTMRLNLSQACHVFQRQCLNYVFKHQSDVVVHFINKILQLLVGY